MTRKLSVLIFEDFKSIGEADEKVSLYRRTFGSCVDVCIIHSLTAAQERMMDPSGGADVILLDIMGENDASVSGGTFRWPLVDGHDLRPFLPILALSFAGVRPVVAMIPWSGNWEHYLRDPEPMSWVALALLLSKLARRPVPWQHLAQELGRRTSFASVESAIGPGVFQYREILSGALSAARPTVSLLPGVTELVSDLGRARERAQDGMVRFPRQKLVVRLQFETGPESIWVESLFADVLDFLRNDVVPSQYSKIIEWFDGWDTVDKEYSAAVEVLRLIPRLDPPPKFGSQSAGFCARFGSSGSRSLRPAHDSPRRRNGKLYGEIVCGLAIEYGLDDVDLHFVEERRSDIVWKPGEDGFEESIATLVGSASPVTRDRLRVLSLQDFESLIANIGAKNELKLNRALRRVLGGVEDRRRHAVLRLVVTLAQVIAFSTQRKGRLRSPSATVRVEVLDTLGMPGDDRSYRQLFEPRNGRGCVGEAEAPSLRYLPPFDPEKHEPRLRYFLHTGAPRLDVALRGFCQEYARNELHWPGDEPDLWPEWMR